MIRRVGDLARGLLAACGIVGLVVGVPAALIAAVGSPLPTSIPSIDAIREALTSRGVDDAVVVKTVALVIWLAWTQIASAFVVELVALLRGRPAPTLPGARSIQVAVAKLLTTTALITSALGGLRAAPATAGPVVIPAVASLTAPSPAVVVPDTQEPSATSPRPTEHANYEVRRHDSLWSIAEGTLGDGLRWREIRDLNAGRTMTDGTILDPVGDTIQPGWILQLPTDARDVGELPLPAPGSVTVHAGDSLWSIAEDTAPTALGHEPTAVELHDHWERIVEANTARLLDASNPGLIFAGQEIEVPSVALSAEPPMVDVVEPAVDVGTTNEITPPRPPAHSGDSETTTTTEAELEAHDDAESTSLLQRFGIAGSALAAGVGAELYRRRRRRAGDLATGYAPAPLPSDLHEIRAAIVLEADDDLAARRNGALRALSHTLAQTDRHVRPLMVQTTPERVEVLLSGPATPASAPWSAEGGGSVWVTTDDLRSTSGLDPSPTLVAIGAPEDGGQLFLDLEAAGILSIVGEGDECECLVRSIVAELDCGAAGERVEVMLIDTDGLALALIDRPETRAWDEVADDLLARCEQAGSLLQANRWRSPFHARAEHEPDDGLAPLVAVLGEIPDDPRFHDLCQRVADGMTTLSLVIMGGHQLGRSVVVGGGLIQVPSLDLTCRSQSLEPEVATEVARLLDFTEGEDQLALLDDVDPTPRICVDLTEAAPVQPDVQVRMLGEIDVVGSRRPLTRKQVSVMAYIALHSPVSAERVEDAVWPTATGSRRKRLANTVSECRSALGAAHVPVAVDGRYSIGPAVGTDVQQFERLVHLAAQAPATEAIELLRTALELVRGPVFTYRSADRASFVWIDLENWLTTWELKVVNTALQLSDLALDAEDVDTAIWAAEHGLRSIPTHTALTEALMRGYWRRGDRGAAERVYLSHVAALEELEIDDVAETTIDLRDQIRANQSA